jgi:hypothetical protein
MKAAKPPHIATPITQCGKSISPPFRLVTPPAWSRTILAVVGRPGGPSVSPADYRTARNRANFFQPIAHPVNRIS